jgi:hypothetical protein
MGQAFTISLILAGVIALFVALGSVTELVVSGQLARCSGGDAWMRASVGSTSTP